jgi:hypothetical protein
LPLGRASLIALFYDWWNIFVRLAEPDRNMEAITSWPLLLSPRSFGRMAFIAQSQSVAGHAGDSPSSSALAPSSFSGVRPFFCRVAAVETAN